MLSRCIQEPDNANRRRDFIWLCLSWFWHPCAFSPIGFWCLYFYAYACGSTCKLSLTIELSFYVVYIIRVHADRNWQTFIAFMVTTVTFTLWHTAATNTWLTTMANVASWKNKLILEQGLKNLKTNQCQKFMLKNCINLYSCRGELKKS